MDIPTIPPPPSTKLFSLFFFHIIRRGFKCHREKCMYLHFYPFLGRPRPINFMPPRFASRYATRCYWTRKLLFFAMFAYVSSERAKKKSLKKHTATWWTFRMIYNLKNCLSIPAMMHTKRILHWKHWREVWELGKKGK